MQTKTLLTPLELKKLLPLDSNTRSTIAKNRLEIKEIFEKKTSKLILIVGPCSFHQTEDLLEYASLLQELSQKVSKHLCLILRVFSEKSRTGSGWRGFLYDPFLNHSHEIETGLIKTRKLLIEINQMNIPCSMEFVDPISSVYFDDVISWGFIGARTSSSQLHRQFASNITIPTGFKNATDGSLEPAIRGVLFSRESQSYIGINEDGRVCQIQSSGNPYSHLVLRGGSHSQNYDFFSVLDAANQLKSHVIPPKILIDCSHGNSQKVVQRQIDVLQNVSKQVLEGNSHILGMMLESFLEEGSQPFSDQAKKGLSVTDPCLSWETTYEEILKLYEQLDHISSDKICAVQN